MGIFNRKNKKQKAIEELFNINNPKHAYIHALTIKELSDMFLSLAKSNENEKVVFMDAKGNFLNVILSSAGHLYFNEGKRGESNRIQKDCLIVKLG